MTETSGDSTLDPSALNEAQRVVGYTFRRPELLVEALTHRSFAYENSAPGVTHNERLEFLGDAVLQLVSSALVYRSFPNDDEGRLTGLRSELVRASALATMARSLPLGPYLRLGRGEDSTGGRDRDLLLASAFEAVLGALFLDGDMPAVQRFLEPRLEELARRIAGQTHLKDSKSLLQEVAQAQLGVTPRYRLVSESGPSHDRAFVVEVLLGERVAARGEGRSKRQAEQEAARVALRDPGWTIHE
ncbi:MAG TPA: ribonuclease III [Ktedonobacterales bacterium]|nr:ribonuclease III [Ktedonobacterales bacterium]